MSDKAIALAKQLIDDYQLSVPINLDRITSKLGIVVSVAPLKSMSGFAYKEGGQKIIGVNKSDGPLRRRFTTAHELGHMLIHDKDPVSYDTKNAFVYFRDASSATGQHLKEVQANAFAAELLMPAEELKGRLEKMGGIDLTADDDKIAQLASEFNVSFTAMTVRIDRLVGKA